MKKIICFILTLILLISFSSCFNNNGVSTSTTPSLETTPSSSMDPDASLLPTPSTSAVRSIKYDAEGNLDYQAMWPDKKILVWLYFDTPGIREYISSLDNPNPKPFNEFYSSIISDELIVAYNDYLISLGKDYVIRFIKQDAIVDKMAEDYKALGDDYNAKQYFKFTKIYGYYINFMKDMKNSGKQADIISSISIVKGTFDIVENGVRIYVNHTAIAESGADEIYNGLLLDITDFLLNDEDKKLYGLFPAEYWSLFDKYNGIYGVYNNEIASSYIFYLRDDVINKYEVDISELDTIDEIDALFEKIYDDYKTEITSSDLMLIRKFLNSSAYNELAGITTDNNYATISYKYDADNNPVVINRFKDADYLHINKILAKWVEKGYFNKSVVSDPDGSASASIAFAPYISYIQRSYVDYSNDFSDDIQYMPVEISRYILHDNRNRLIGIASWTGNAESAFDFLSTLYTDPHLSNLLYYGKDYEYKDGIVKQNGNYSAYVLTASHIIYPNKVGEKRISDFTDTMNDVYVTPNYDFEPDISGMEYNFEEMDRLCKEADDLWATHSDNLLSELENIIKQLEALGYDRFLQDINKQLVQYIKSKP
jgi:hypothetical protein